MILRDIIIGYALSVFGGAILLWLLIDKLAWHHLEKYGIKKKSSAVLTLPMGMIERLLFTTAFLIQQPAFIPI